ncbi:type II toxin-antitoxin system HicB family antitoxin [Hymenobacter puniceus]|uniref:type II toxin-antitoxin system HicB family antitoxin n=1 Tax=Hymenobacter sp. BT190 TaxID=2763505 RepID=UPI001650FEA4|nr:XRE family transcriptional regulator [Hymenobacter sp. BT190]MBC6700175.1 XRE family transcriptional regulator [Hymenobacter sp. BT190]
MKTIEISVERTDTGYSAYTLDYPVATVGATLSELKTNMVEALNLYFEEVSGKPVTLANIRVTLDLPQFFEFYKVINATALSKRIGMNQSLLAQYISGGKKPSAEQVNRILVGVREIGKELAEMELV